MSLYSLLVISFKRPDNEKSCCFVLVTIESDFFEHFISYNEVVHVQLFLIGFNVTIFQLHVCLFCITCAWALYD